MHGQGRGGFTGRAGGFTTVQYVVVSALSLLLLVLVGNVLVSLYARGVVRDALDEGARAGVVERAGVAECEARAGEVLDALLSGAIGARVTVECEADGPRIVARARGALPSWLPMLVPDWELDVDAVALRDS